MARLSYTIMELEGLAIKHPGELIISPPSAPHFGTNTDSIATKGNGKGSGGPSLSVGNVVVAGAVICAGSSLDWICRRKQSSIIDIIDKSVTIGISYAASCPKI